MQKNESIFEYSDYRGYLLARLPTSGEGRGIRSKLAQAMRCQVAFVSRVLHNEADFSLEHAVVINEFLGHSESESDFFLLLVQVARAGSTKLKQHYQKQIAAIHEKRELISERIQVKKQLTSEDQMTYYSAWQYSAIHTILLIPHLRKKAEIAKVLGLPVSLVTKCLEFLVSVALAEEKNGEYFPATSRTHLAKGSPMLLRHHGNWRMRAIAVLDRMSEEDLFYSGPVALSRANAEKLRAQYLKFLEQIEPLIQAPGEEEIYCINLDFFRV